MTQHLSEKRIDHHGQRLPPGVYALTREDGTIASYKTRWREEDPHGLPRNASKSFSIRAHGSPDKALARATQHREQALHMVATTGAMTNPASTSTTTVNQLFQEWCVKRGALLSQRYAEDAAKRWDREIAPRPIAKMRLTRLSRDPAAITRFQDELLTDGLTSSNRTQILKTLRAVLRWGRRRHPESLTLELSGLFELPKHNPTRLAYATDAYSIERIIEAILTRPTKNTLLPIRDAALVAAMAFTIAARPSEWLYSATWRDIHPNSVELQRPNSHTPDEPFGLKTGARAALLLPNAHDRLSEYRTALENHFGPIPEHALVFQTLTPNGPKWANQTNQTTPKPWTTNDYKRWTARIWRPARNAAALTKDVPQAVASMRFYDCRHTAISMALHSNLVTGPYGMNLHNLAGWAGHDVQTLQRYYAHIIARYQNTDPIDLTAECQAARRRVETEPSR